jgi:hypothetical protein
MNARKLMDSASTLVAFDKGLPAIEGSVDNVSDATVSASSDGCPLRFRGSRSWRAANPASSPRRDRMPWMFGPRRECRGRFPSRSSAPFRGR